MTMKKGLFGAGIAVLISVGLLGCGMEPGAEFLGGSYDDIDLPISGNLQRIAQGYDHLASGAISAARTTFLSVINDRPKASDMAMAKVGLGFADVRSLGSSEGIQEFEEAYAGDPTNPDARVGLAGALISKGGADNIRRATQLLEGMDNGNAAFNYADRWKLGISNAEVHALLAYAYKLDGETAKSRTQAEIARNLDANLDNTTVDQILAVLQFIP